MLVCYSVRQGKKVSIYHFTNLVEEEVIDVVSEEGSELALLGLAWPHVHLYFLNEPGQNSQDKQTLEQLGYQAASERHP